MAPQVVSRTRAELTARRDELLTQLGVASIADADALAHAGDLSGRDLHLIDLLHDVEYLLGEG